MNVSSINNLAAPLLLIYTLSLKQDVKALMNYPAGKDWLIIKLNVL